MKKLETALETYTNEVCVNGDSIKCKLLQKEFINALRDMIQEEIQDALCHRDYDAQEEL
jgi:hypothetical protein